MVVLGEHDGGGGIGALDRRIRRAEHRRVGAGVRSRGPEAHDVRFVPHLVDVYAQTRVAPDDPGEEARVVGEASRAVVDVPAVCTVDGALARIAGRPEGNPIGDRHDHADPGAMEARDGVVEVAEQALVMPSARCGLDPVPADVHPDPGDVRALEQPDLAVDVRPRDAVGELGVGAGVGRAGAGDAGEAHQNDERGEGRERRRTRDLEGVHAVSTTSSPPYPPARGSDTRSAVDARAGRRARHQPCVPNRRAPCAPSSPRGRGRRATREPHGRCPCGRPEGALSTTSGWPRSHGRAARA